MAKISLQNNTTVKVHKKKFYHKIKSFTKIKYI